MALDFTALNAHLTLAGGAVFSNYPFTMACWFIENTNPAISQGQPNPTALMSMTSSGSNNPEQQIGTVNNGTDDKRLIEARSRALFGQSVAAIGTVDVYLGGWQHAAGVFSSGSLRKIYTDGGDESSNSSSSPFVSSITQSSIAARLGTGLSESFLGKIAEAGWWNVALSAPEISDLAKGVSPLKVRPQNLIAYHKMIGRSSPEPDMMGTRVATLVNSPTHYDHPRIFQPQTMSISASPPAPPTEGYKVFLKAGSLPDVGVDQPIRVIGKDVTLDHILDRKTVLVPDATYFGSVLPFNSKGDAQTPAVFGFQTDSGANPKFTPAPVSGLSAVALDSGKLSVRWTYDESSPLAIADDFKIEIFNESSSFDLTVAHSPPRRSYSAELAIGNDGIYEVRVLSQKAGLSQWQVGTVRVLIDSSPPAAVALVMTAVN